jgi:hypothetical protein
MVENNRYILVSYYDEELDSFRYAGFKFLSQGPTSDHLITYEFITLYDGESKVKIDNQNFDFGETGIQARFGVNFDGYRFSWRPVGREGVGEIAYVKQNNGRIKFCISKHIEIWNLDLREQIEKLENNNSCF